MAGGVVGNEKRRWVDEGEAAGCDDDGVALAFSPQNPLLPDTRFKPPPTISIHPLARPYTHLPTSLPDKPQNLNLRHRNGHQQILCQKCNIL